MTAYNVYLVKLGSVSINEQQVATVLKGLFDRVIASNAQLRQRFDESARIHWRSDCPEVLPHELVVYVMQSSVDSVVSTYFQGGFSDADGTTAWNDQVTGSEVYIGSFTPPLLAKLAFHEAMHNKLHWDSRRLHGTDGGGGLASATIREDTELTPTNIHIMARVLGENRPQWTGGCSYHNDPLRGL